MENGVIGISEKRRFDVTPELYPAFELGQDAASGAVVAVDSAGSLAEFTEHADCETETESDWSLMIGY